MSYYDNEGKTKTNPETWEEKAKEAAADFELGKSMDHPYLKEKQIERGSTRVGLKGDLLIPGYDINKKLWTYQSITQKSDGSFLKKFLTGAKKQTTFHPLGSLPDPETFEGKIGIAEGYATASTLHEALGFTIICAWDCWNMRDVAPIIQKHYPKAKIEIFADNDLHTRDKKTGQIINNGKLVAQAIGKLTGVRVIAPYFKNPKDKTYSDFNDMRRVSGLQSVQRQYLHKLSGIFQEKDFGFDLCTLEELAAQPQEEFDYVIEKLILKGGSSIMAATPKTGKSTIGRQMAWAVARGQPFFGLECKKGPVLYFAVDEGKKVVEKQWDFMTAGAWKHNKDITIMTRDKKLPEKDMENKLEKLCNRDKFALIIVDTLFNFAQIDDTDKYALVIKAMRPLIDIAARTNAHICFIHHMNKGGYDTDVAKLTFRNMMGSTGFHSLVDTCIGLGRDADDRRCLWTESRMGDDLEKHWIDFNPESRMYELGQGVKEAKVKERSEDVDAAIIGFVRDHPRCSGRQIRKGVRGKDTFISDRINELADRGQLVVEKSKHRGAGAAYVVATNKNNQVKDDAEY